MQKQRDADYSLAQQYVSQQSGWRKLVICLGLAFLFSSAIRIYFSPELMMSRAQEFIQKLPPEYQLSIDSIELSLADGWTPQLGVRARGLRLIAYPECHSAEQAGLAIQELILPFSLSSLLTGEAKLSPIIMRGFELDIDALKPCRSPASIDKAESDGAEPRSEVLVSTQGSSKKEQVLLQPKTFFKEEDLRKISRWVEGVSIESGDLYFENRSKKVRVENLVVDLQAAETIVPIEFDLRVPAELTYGESLPLVHLRATLASNEADFIFVGHLSEGNVEGRAKLINYESGPHIDASVDVKSVPLSRLIPVMRKAQLDVGSFDPKFLWLSCRASVVGQFQGVFKKSPLQFDNCHIEGEAGHVSIESATRMPRGDWKPFSANLKNLDIKKILTFSQIEGPSGVATRYGSLSGKLQFESLERQTFSGDLQSARVYFSSFNRWKEQELKRIQLNVTRQGKEVSLSIPEIELVGGEFAGKLESKLNLETHAVSSIVDIKNLSLAPFIQELMFFGSYENLQLQGRVDYDPKKQLDGRLKLALTGYANSQLKAKQVNIDARMEQSGVVMQTHIPNMDWLGSKDASLSTLPFLAGGEMSFSDVRMNMQVSPDRLLCQKFQALMAGGKRLEGQGELVGFGQLSVELAALEKSKPTSRWRLTGPMSRVRVEAL